MKLMDYRNLGNAGVIALLQLDNGDFFWRHRLLGQPDSDWPEYRFEDLDALEAFIRAKNKITPEEAKSLVTAVTKLKEKKLPHERGMMDGE